MESERRMYTKKGIDSVRRARDSNPQALAGASFQDWCNSRSASSPELVWKYTEKAVGEQLRVNTKEARNL